VSPGLPAALPTRAPEPRPGLPFLAIVAGFAARSSRRKKDFSEMAIAR
jgi:hypothetical protein